MKIWCLLFDAAARTPFRRKSFFRLYGDLRGAREGSRISILAHLQFYFFKRLFFVICTCLQQKKQILLHKLSFTIVGHKSDDCSGRDRWCSELKSFIWLFENVNVPYKNTVRLRFSIKFVFRTSLWILLQTLFIHIICQR